MKFTIPVILFSILLVDSTQSLSSSQLNIIELHRRFLSEEQFEDFHRNLQRCGWRNCLLERMGFGRGGEGGWGWGGRGGSGGGGGGCEVEGGGLSSEEHDTIMYIANIYKSIQRSSKLITNDEGSGHLMHPFWTPKPWKTRILPNLHQPPSSIVIS
jgi:hypothetical protein